MKPQKEAEKRVARLSIAMTPTLLEDFKILADVLNLSSNELAIKTFTAAVKQHAATIQAVKQARQESKFDSLFSDNVADERSEE